MKMALSRLEILTLRVHATVLVMIMVPIYIKYGWIETGFCTTEFGDFSSGGKAIRRSPLDKLHDG